MIRPEPRKPDRKRDELAKNVHILSTDLMSKGAKALTLFRRAQKQGASRLEAFEASKEGAGPGESGVWERPDKVPVFHLSDKDVQIKPGVESYLSGADTSGGRLAETPWSTMEDYVTADDLFSRVPAMRDTRLRLSRPGPPMSKWDKPFPGQGSYRSVEEGATKGEIDIISRHGTGLNEQSNFSARDLLMHEGQHRAADIAGWGRGDSKKNDFMIAEHSRLVHPRVMKYKAALEDHLLQSGLPRDEWARLYPEAHTYLMEATRLAGPKGRNPKISRLDEHSRYENVVEENEARRNAAMSRGGDFYTDVLKPWDPLYGQFSPQEFQMLRSSKHDYSMPDARGLLARLTKPPQGR